MAQDNTTKKSPMNATYDQLCCMKRDNFSAGGYYIRTDSYNVFISATAQLDTCACGRRQRIEISRKRFNQLLRWYMSEQEVK